jgi:hypothetical protein
MTEAEARIGKRVRVLNSTHSVPQGTTGTVISAIRIDSAVGPVMALGIGGKTPNPTDTAWVVEIEFDDALKTTTLLDEWDDSLEEI